MSNEIILCFNDKLVAFLDLNGFPAELVPLNRLPFGASNLSRSFFSTIDGLGIAHFLTIPIDLHILATIMKMTMHIVDVAGLFDNVRGRSNDMPGVGRRI
jgi:hypothetical protein